MTSLDSPPTQKHMEILNIDISNKCEDNNFAIVFFESETHSLKGDSDILLIGIKCHDCVLSIFLSPCQFIQASATGVHVHKSRVYKKLFHHGVELPKILKKSACKKVLEYVQV